MADNEAQVKITASIGELKAAMLEGATSVKEFSAQTKEHIESLTGVFEKLNGIMIGFAAVLAGGAAFKEVIEGSEKWTESVRDLSLQLGITSSQASSLNGALSIIGVSAETFTSAALKLDRQIRTNEEGLNKLGVATRNSSGQLLDNQQIMLNAISTMTEYKAGTDRNLAGIQIFGRGVGDTTNLLRLNSEKLQEGTEAVQKYGLAVDQEGIEASLRYSESLNTVGLAFDGVKRRIAESIIPLLTELAESFNKNSIASRTLEAVIKTLETAFLALEAAAVTIIDGIGYAFAKVTLKAQAFGESLVAVAKLDFSGAEAAWDDYGVKVAAVSDASAKKFKSDMEEIKKSLASVWGDENKPKTPGGGEGGADIPNGTKTYTDTSSGAAAANADKGKEEDKLRELAVAKDKLLAQDAVKTAQDKNKELLDLDQITNTQYLQNKLDLQKQLDAIDLQAANDKRDAIQNDVVAQAKADNDIIALKQKQAHDEEAIRHQITMDSQVDQKQLATQINSSFSTMIGSFVDGSKTMKKSFSDFALSVIDDIAKIAEKNMISALFGSGGASGNGGGIGALLASSMSFGGARAGGGDVSNGKGYIVGENGPEYFMPSTNGTILNQSQIGQAQNNQGGNITVNMSISTPNAQSFRQNTGQIMADMQNAMRSRGMRNA